MTLEGALRCLREARVVAAPTETWYGLLADATSVPALDALLAAKPRDSKGIPAIFGHPEELPAWVDAPPAVLRWAGGFWPGPLTLVARAQPGRWDPRMVFDGAVAVRIPGPSLAADLAVRLPFPLTSTSANPPGEPPARTGWEVRQRFGEQLPVLDGESPGGPPSTIVRWTGAAWTVLREGVVPATALAERALRHGLAELSKSAS
jgi:tRNA threonylcarbamoyl adenosine modification protein (Sua5/YciO/YrdC/YwlC family)